jgi:hypothetical protein
MLWVSTKRLEMSEAVAPLSKYKSADIPLTVPFIFNSSTGLSKAVKVGIAVKTFVVRIFYCLRFN